MLLLFVVPVAVVVVVVPEADVVVLVVDVVVVLLLVDPSEDEDELEDDDDDEDLLSSSSKSFWNCFLLGASSPARKGNGRSRSFSSGAGVHMLISMRRDFDFFSSKLNSKKTEKTLDQNLI